jgi:hypothetical protein
VHSAYTFALAFPA